ncbi:hypothetical protein [Altericista sp. CCNU0014]|uniref:SPOR domain-containing protein n=1 Tax=Altericista sp. CCNU0014 TaxID=3082949 RepID=UPI00384AF0D9
MSVENQPISLPEGLKAAIACLDLSLESELALYRDRQSQAASALALPSADPDDAVLPSSDSTLEAFLATDDARTFSAEANNVSDEPEATEGELDRVTAELESEDESETLPEPYGAELTAQPKAFDRFLDPSIEDYLESSEALLKHLDEPTETEPSPAREPAPPASKQRWVVGAGIVLLVLGAIALAGLFVMLAQRWFSAKPSAPAVTPQSSASPPLQPTPSISPLSNSAIATEAVSANLAKTGALPPRPSATPTPSPTPSIDPNAANYIVLAANGSAETLRKARRLVPDAFVTDVSGQRRIQLGSLDSLQQAQQMVNELKNQGFPASIVAQN